MSVGKQTRSSPSASSYARQLDVPSYPLSTPNSPTRPSPSTSPTQSTPARRSSSIARPALSRAGPSFVPRLSRSASERPSSRTGPSSLLPSPTIPSPTAQRSPTSYGRSSLQLRRVSPASETLAARRSAAGSRDIDVPRTNAASRLILPSRHRSGSASGRPHVRSLEPASPSWDVGDSVSARGVSAGSPASAELRSNMPRPSLDGGSVRSSSRIGGRERSSSLGESTQYHPTRLRPTDWLGPRTTKAFAAAGLLDFEKDGIAASASRPGSRFSSTRSERDMRSQYAPSRMAFSETGSRSSWSRRSGSISRTAASSDVLSSHGGPLSSESASIPRTLFSSSSTAPTSVSAASSAHKHLQTELQLLQDRHSLETGALLNALADSQRTTRLLREENVQLRDQVQQLEDRLANVVEELRRLQLPPPPKPPRNNFYRLAGANAHTAADDARRTLPRSRLQTVFPPDPELVREDDFELPDPPNRNHPHELAPAYDSMPMPSDSLQPQMIDPYSDTISRRRHSGSSSIFPILPSNMSMLLHDEGGPERRQARSLSPSPAVSHVPLPGEISSKMDQEVFDFHQKTTSVGNISPTTATFSMITNSPRSLCLRPEHERLLGDMPTLDLCAEDYEHDEYDDDRHGS
ncbi:hypothetical protein EIP86_010424 [Pleurotus ostreatoroseus]|nr:hypothetical protein EIP86_010424 [Pleurotus ostreatoroseus]